MASYLTNPKMSPALRARIEASVGGRTHRRTGALRLRTTLRIVAALLVVGAVAGVARRWHAGRAAREAMRSALREDLARGVAPLRERQEAIASLHDHLRAAAARYDGDRLDPRLGEPDALAAHLARPAIYARAPLASDHLAERAAESPKDAFLACLMAPPASTAERDLMRGVDRAYRGGAAIAEITPKVRRLHDVVAAEPLLDARWARRIDDATEATELASLRRQIEDAHLARAAEAARAELLIYVLDEPAEAGASIALDGASDHLVRVGLIDLTTGETLLRVRRRVRLDWISEGRRPHFARGLLDCRLAAELRAEPARGDAPR